MTPALHVEEQGNAARPVLLLHGLGCNGAVWDPLVPLLHDRGFGTIVPDFAGHGRSAWSSAYSLAGHAAAVAAVVTRDRPVRIIGHSMGATIGMILSSALFETQVSSLFAIALKIDWTAEEVQRMGEIRSTRRFATRSEAAQRFLRVTGLSGLIRENHRCAQAGIIEDSNGVRLAADPRTAAVVHEPVAPVVARARADKVSFRLSCGTADRLVDIASLREWDSEAIPFQGYQHNVHVEAPEAVLDAFLKQDATEP